MDSVTGQECEDSSSNGTSINLSTPVTMETPCGSTSVNCLPLSTEVPHLRLLFTTKPWKCLYL